MEIGGTVPLSAIGGTPLRFRAVVSRPPFGSASLAGCCARIVGAAAHSCVDLEGSFHRGSHRGKGRVSVVVMAEKGPQQRALVRADHPAAASAEAEYRGSVEDEVATLSVARRNGGAAASGRGR